MKIINFDSDLAYRQKEEVEQKIKEMKEEATKSFKKTQRVGWITLPVVIALFSLAGKALFNWDYKWGSFNIGLHHLVFFLSVLVVGIFYIALLSNNKSYIEETGKDTSYTPLTKYYFYTQNRVFKEQTMNLNPCFGGYELEIITVEADDIVRKKTIRLAGFETLTKAYIKEPEVDLVNKIIYLPYIKENSNKKENT